MEKAEILKEIIESRRSIFPKDYTGEEIEQEILDEILRSATFAPNHKRTKPWRFKIFKGEEKNGWEKSWPRFIKIPLRHSIFSKKNI